MISRTEAAAATLLAWACLLTLQGNAQQQLVTEPWEPAAKCRSTPVTRSDTSFSPVQILASTVISVYREQVGVHSISRCPFFISCSRFAGSAVQIHGVMGVFMFIDRYFFREHAMAYSLYPLRVTDGGYLKIDDTFFLQP